MLIVPIDVPAWAANLGVIKAERVYKGLCGPNGAVIQIDELYREAEKDLN